MKFKYQGFQAAGKAITGHIDGENENDVRIKLKGQGVWVKHLRLVDSGPEEPAGPGAAKSSAGGGRRSSKASVVPAGFFESPPTPTQFTAFIRQLATMIGAGIPIVQALGILGEQSDNKMLGRALGEMKHKIEGGLSLTETLAMYPKIFDRIFLNLIAAGEASGTIDKVLLRLATHYEKSSAINRKVRGAMMYPMVMSGIITVVVIVLLVFVVPSFAEMFASSGKALPAPTQLVMDISNFLRDNIFIIIVALAGTVVGLRSVWKNPQARKGIDPVLLKLPFFGDLIMKVSIARFSRTLSTMIEAGVPILDALSITSRVSGNYHIESNVMKTRDAITSGRTLAEPLATAKIFPKMAVSMIAVGEQTGALSQMLVKIAEFYEDEVDTVISSLSSVIEPVMMVVIGLVAAGILIPMYLPIFKMGEAMGG